MLVKFCGMTRQADVDAALRLGADCCGFIFHEGSPRALRPEAAARLASGTLKRVGVFVLQNADAILRTVARARLDWVQVHGAQTLACEAELARAIGPERVIRVLWPGRHASLAGLEAEMRSHAAYCGHFLLDAGTTGTGGSGRNLDWQALAALRAPRPWILAGGLDADRLGLAIVQSRPDGVDLNSGVEDAPGLKNHGKMAAAEAAIRSVSAELRTLHRSLGGRNGAGSAHE